MKFYHCTNATKAIMAEGFKDGKLGRSSALSLIFMDQTYSGVFLSDQPVDANEGAKGESVIVIEIPEKEILEYELVEEGKGYREFLIPAHILNQYRPFEILEE